MGAGHRPESTSSVEDEIAFGRPLYCHSAPRRGPRVFECRGRANKLWYFYLFTMWTIRVLDLETVGVSRERDSS
jgi:hypothetical protein